MPSSPIVPFASSPFLPPAALSRIAAGGPRASRLAAAAAFPVAALLAASSRGGRICPSTYARETPNWVAQAVGQDWANLVFAVPWLVVTGAVARRGSRRALLLLEGGFVYAAYTLAIYAFSIKFNWLFLVYCANLGLATYAAAAGLVGLFADESIPERAATQTPRRSGVALLMTIAIGFALLWLSEIVPALVTGSLPASIGEAGTATNPVHVLDLAVVLPAHAAAAVLLFRRERAASIVAPVLLAFDVLMALAIAVVMLVMRQRHQPASLVVAAALTALAMAAAAILMAFLRGRTTS